jgi:hypothetical protein
LYLRQQILAQSVIQKSILQTIQAAEAAVAPGILVQTVDHRPPPMAVVEVGGD